MYRALAHLALRNEIDLDNQHALLRLLEQYPVRVELDAESASGYRVFAGERELGPELTSSEVTAAVSIVAAHPLVREKMVEQQRTIASRGPVVMAGRDIGSVVLPDAPFKVYLTASLPARVERRRAELQAKGIDVDVHRLAQELAERDALDQTRPTSPLRVAPGAVEIDSSSLSADDVTDEIVRRVKSAATA